MTVEAIDLEKPTQAQDTKQWGSTPRTQTLTALLRKRGCSDRSGEWMRQDMFPQDIGKSGEPVIIRKAKACKAMLEALANQENSKTSHTYEIRTGELIVGVIPMGSVGLGKEFPPYLTEEEKRIASFSSRDEGSTFGHNCPDHHRVLEKGLSHIIETCKQKIAFLEAEVQAPLGGDRDWLRKKINFYTAVQISSQAVVDYAAAYADLAEKQAALEPDPQRQAELTEIARICRKVPLQPADTFHEAVQSIYFVHLALHSFMNLISIGRLDQLLQPYLSASLQNKDIDKVGAQELIECFLIKCGERINMTSEYLVKQDHLDFGTGLGTNPIFLDQIASANNFLQNIVIGGQDREGKDATCDMTYVILDAVSAIGIPTPTVNLRLHDGSPAKLRQAAGETLCNGKVGLPIIYNDETVVPGLVEAGVPKEEALDYVVDGCWEPILNATGDWTFGMIHMLTCLECALNSGRLLTNDPNTLAGKKMAYRTTPPEQINSFKTLQEQMEKHIGFFSDKVALQLYNFYSIDASVTPTPFFSALLSDCLEKGIDKTWGGAEYNLGGVISIAAPNAANALAAIKLWVFEKQKYTLPQVVQVLKNDYDYTHELTPEQRQAVRQGQKVQLTEKEQQIKTLYDEMYNDFASAPKFGNNDPYVDSLMRWLLDTFHTAVHRAATLAEEVFLEEPTTAKDRNRVKLLRAMAGYDGESMRKKYGKDFKILLSTGAGTFGQYSFMGRGVNASADARKKNEPVAPNCSPIPGTMNGGIGHLLGSTKRLELDRFGSGLVYDVCLDTALDKPDKVAAVLDNFVKNRGNIMTVSIADHAQLQKIFDLSEDVRRQEKPSSVLDPHAQLSVRVGGWNAPFVTFSQEQQKNYLDRGLDK